MVSASPWLGWAWPGRHNKNTTGQRKNQADPEQRVREWTKMENDIEQINLLKIFHYIVGGLGCLFSCTPLLHVGLGIFLLTSPETLTGQNNQAPMPDWFGYIIIGAGSLFFLLGQALSICIIYSGKCLKNRKKYMFSFVIACLSCMIFPFGTILGVFTIVVLSRESVKKMYSAA